MEYNIIYTIDFLIIVPVFLSIRNVNFFIFFSICLNYFYLAIVAFFARQLSIFSIRSVFKIQFFAKIFEFYNQQNFFSLILFYLFIFSSISNLIKRDFFELQDHDRDMIIFAIVNVFPKDSFPIIFHCCKSSFKVLL